MTSDKTMSPHLVPHSPSTSKDEQALIKLKTGHLCSPNVLAYRLEQARRTLHKQQPNLNSILFAMITAYFNNIEHTKTPLKQYLPDMLRLCLCLMREHPQVIDYLKPSYKLLNDPLDASILDIHFYYLRMFGLPKKLNTILQVILAPDNYDRLSKREKMRCDAFQKAISKDYSLIENCICEESNEQGTGWKNLPILNWLHQNNSSRR
jgi:hypothetical protein